MNWTGGRLQRHSKANANTQLKNQKRYFARARQRLQNGNRPPSPSTFSILKGQLDSQSACQQRTLLPPARTSEQNPRRTPSKNHEVERGTRQGSAISVGSSSPAEYSLAPSRTKVRAKFQSPDREVPNSPRKYPTATALDEIKQRLLANSDWVRLAPTRPVRMTFISAQEMEKIGRRRKITAEEKRKRNLGNRHQRSHHEIIRPVRYQDDQSYNAPLKEEDYSIRLGSNIHRTQTTRESLNRQSRVSVPPSNFSNSMLLDTFDTAKQGTAQANIWLEVPSTTETDPARNVKVSVNQNLVPLNEALDLKSWEEVLERSSSRSFVQGKAPSSTPFIDCSASKLSVPNTSTKTTGSDEGPHDLQHSKDAAKAADRRRCDLQSVAGPDGGAPQLNRGSNLLRRPRSPRFTLDYQVRLEQELPSSAIEDSGVPPSASASASPMTSKYPTTHPLWRPTRLDGSLPSAGNFVAIQKHDPLNGGLDASVEDSNEKPKQPHSLTWMERFQHAKAQHEQEIAQRPTSAQLHSQGPGRLADENEAWMRYVFPTEFEQIQKSFTFANPNKINRTENTASTIEATSPPGGIHAEPFDYQDLTYNQEIVASTPLALTNVNSTIFNPHLELERSHAESIRSDETDFLSRYSPMSGVIDDALGPISTYTNRARSNRTFRCQVGTTTWNPPLADQSQILLKRTAEQAFPDTSFSPAQSQSSLRHRQPLRPIAQPRLCRTQKSHAAVKQVDHSARADSYSTPRRRNYRQALSLPKSKHVTGRRGTAAFPLTYSPQSSVSHSNVTGHHHTPHFVSRQDGSLCSDSDISAMSASQHAVGQHQTAPNGGRRLPNIHTASTQSRQPVTSQFANPPIRSKHEKSLHVPLRISQPDSSPPAACQSALRGFKFLDVAS